MGLLNAIVNDAQDVKASEEYVASGSKKIEESGCYVGKINMAKVKESDGGALGIEFEIETEDGRKLYDTIWMTTKEKKPYYINKDGEKRELPGFAQISGLNYLINNVWGMPETEEKEVKEYDWNTSKERFVKRDVVTSWLNKPIGACVEVAIEDKYSNKTESVTTRRIKHFFDPVTNKFASEKKAGAEACNVDLFKKNAELTPVKDLREMSKGGATTLASTVLPGTSSGPVPF